MRRAQIVSVVGVLLVTSACRDDKLSAGNVAQRTTAASRRCSVTPVVRWIHCLRIKRSRRQAPRLENVGAVLETMGLVAASDPMAQGIKAKGLRTLRAMQAPESDASADFDEAAAEIAQFLETKIFTDANVESSGDGYAVFLHPRGSALRAGGM